MLVSCSAKKILLNAHLSVMSFPPCVSSRGCSCSCSPFQVVFPQIPDSPHTPLPSGLWCARTHTHHCGLRTFAQVFPSSTVESQRLQAYLHHRSCFSCFIIQATTVHSLSWTGLCTLGAPAALALNQHYRADWCSTQTSKVMAEMGPGIPCLPVWVKAPAATPACPWQSPETGPAVAWRAGPPAPVQ